MNCKKEWSRRFLRDAFTTAFLTSRYKEHVKNTLFEREKSFMPATQPHIELQKMRDAKMREIEELHMQIAEIRIKIQEKYREYGALGNGNPNGKLASRKYVRPCGYNDCRGFMDDKHECGICGQKSCPKCDVFLNIGSTHECKEEDIETAKLLRKDTRPCPKCNVAIFKISGCDQMWCVQCHTAFSWNSGEIEDRIHNPHYFEWMAQQAAQNNQTRNEFLNEQREIYEGLCNNVLTHRMAQQLVGRAADYYYMNPQITHEYSWGDVASEIIMNGIHMRYVDLPRYRVADREEAEESNLQQRIFYMTGKLTELEFKEYVDKKERRYEKYREYSQIIDMYLTVVLDITCRLLDYTASPGDKQHEHMGFLQEYNTIREHANKCFEDASKAYFSTAKYIDDRGRLL